MICPGSEDGTSPEFLTMKFPLVPVSESLVPSVPPGVGLAPNNAAVFLTPVNFKPDGAIITPTSKSFVMQPSTSRDNIKKDIITTDSASITQLKDGNASSKQHISSSEVMPSFQSGELTVSVKNAKCDYDFAPTDFSKISNPLGTDTSINKTRSSTTSDFPLADITQQISKFSDLSKLANFSTADLAKLSGFPIPDFARTSSPSPSAYMRNIANLFGPIGKISPARDIESNERKSNDFSIVDPIQSPFKVSSGSSESCRNFSVNPEDYSTDRKKMDVQNDNVKLNRSNEYQGTEDLSISKSEFSGMLDMTTIHKKQQQSQSGDIGDSLNLSKDRQ